MMLKVQVTRYEVRICSPYFVRTSLFEETIRMSKHILKELPDLIEAQVITEETAQRIKDYYDHQPGQSANRLFIVFGILGRLLVGMGIVLIIAHNWDNLPKIAKLAVGFLPLLIGQAYVVT